MLLAFCTGEQRAFASMPALVLFFLVYQSICHHEHIQFHTREIAEQLYMSAFTALTIFANHADQQAAPVGGQFEQRSNPHQRVIATTQVRRGAAPAISAWCVHQARADGVELDLARGCQQIGFIERER
jgi:hypothetical protein